MPKDWNSLLTLKSPCYGVVVFDNSVDSCVIVKTHPDKEGNQNVGFPKGKCEKSKITKERENIFTSSSRELEEESGIKFSQLVFADGVFINELSNKGNVSITYLVAKFKSLKQDSEQDSEHTFTFDLDELEFSGFVPIVEAHKTMWKIRSNILSLAYNIITDPSTSFTDGQLLLDKYKLSLLTNSKELGNTSLSPKGVKLSLLGNTSLSPKDVKLSLLTNSKELGNTSLSPKDVKLSLLGNKTNYSLMKISKTMSYVLRHGAKELGIAMDDEARILVSDLLALPNMSKVSIDELMQVVDNNDKKRFEVQTVNGNLMIRAVQGHSKTFNDIIDEEKLLDEIIVPLEKCIHGTDSNAWEIIKKDGLKPISRMHIHCAISEPEDKQIISGMRTSAKVLIYIDMKKAMDDGIKFYLSKNKVILTKGYNGVLEPKYFKEVIKQSQP
jgi:2'-phosphotransferase